MLKKSNWKKHVTLSMICDIESLDRHFTQVSIETYYDVTSRHSKWMTIPYMIMKTQGTLYMIQLLGMGVTQSNKISSGRMKNKPISYYIKRATLQFIIIWWTNQIIYLRKETKGPNSSHS